MAPSASKLKKLKASLDCGVIDVLEYSADPHAIAGEHFCSLSSLDVAVSFKADCSYKRSDNTAISI